MDDSPIVYCIATYTGLFFLWDFDLLLDVCACLEFINSGMFSCGSGDLTA